MRIISIVALAAVAGCASAPSGQKPGAPAPASTAGSGSSSPAVTAPEIVVSTQNSAFGKTIYSETRRSSRAVTVPLDKAWGVLPAIYKRYGFELSRYDSVSHVISGQRARSRAPIGDKPLTSLLDCGDFAGIPNVTRYDINIQLETTLEPASDGTIVMTHVTGIAKPTGFAGDPQLCTTTITMDNQLATLVADAIRKAAQ